MRSGREEEGTLEAKMGCWGLLPVSKAVHPKSTNLEHSIHLLNKYLAGKCQGQFTCGLINEYTLTDGNECQDTNRVQ